MSTNAVATTTRNDIRSLLAKPETIRELGRVATKHLTADRLARLVLSACNRVPKLLECTPQSVLQCAITCSQYGVEPDGRHAHLIPYGNQCTLIIDWKGMVALGRRGGVEGIVADTICASDEFTYFRDEAGTHFRHVPKFGDRGEIIGAYSTARIDGQFDVEVLTRDEIDGIRKRSRAGGSGPWVTDFGEMAKKTAIRRHSKRWPLSEDIAGAFTADDDVPEGIKRSTATTAAGPSFAALPESTGDTTAEAAAGLAPAQEPTPTEARTKRPYVRKPVAPPVPVETPPDDPAAEVAPAAEPEATGPVETPQDQLANLVVGAGFDFGAFQDALVRLNWFPEATVNGWPSFADVSTDIATRLLNAKRGLLAAMNPTTQPG